MRKEERVVFYCDEVEDDFGTAHKREDVYKGKRRVVVERRGVYDFLSNVLMFFVIPILKLVVFLSGTKWIGRENLKRIPKDEGFFMYANHAGVLDVMASYLIGGKRRANAVGYSDALANPFTHFLVPLLGFIPLPVDIHDTPSFTRAIRFYASEKRQVVVVYPEAHLWPTYTGVRNFKRQSFRYPVDLDRKVLPVFFARRPRKGFWKLFSKPRITVLIGQPLARDPSLPAKQAVEDLGERTYRALLSLSQSIPQEEYWRYVRVPPCEGKASEVR